MVKIKVQEKYLFVEYLVLLALLTGTAIWLNSFISSITTYEYNNDWLLATYSFFALLLFLGKFNDNERYVSDLIIDKDDLEIIYKVKHKTIKVKKISLKDIRSITTAISAHSTGFITVNRSITEIILNNGSMVRFQEESESFFKSSCNFLMRMIKSRQFLPNFTYKLDNNLYDKMTKKLVLSDFE